MAHVVRRLIEVPDRAGAEAILASHDFLRHPGPVFLLHHRAGQARAGGYQDVAEHLEERVALVAGTTRAELLNAVLTLARAERSLPEPGPVLPGDGPALVTAGDQALLRAGEAVTGVLALDCEPLDPLLRVSLHDMAARLADRLALAPQAPAAAGADPARNGDDDAPAWLAAAVTATVRAVAACPADRPDRARHLNNLAVRLARLHEATGDWDLLEEAYGHACQAVGLTATGSPELGVRVNTLANRLEHLYRSGLGGPAPAAVPGDATDRSERLHRLAVALVARTQAGAPAGGDDRILRESVALAGEAASGAGDDGLRSRCRTTLALALTRLAWLTADQPSLAEVRAAAEAALRPGDAAGQADGLALLAGDLASLARARPGTEPEAPRLLATAAAAYDASLALTPAGTAEWRDRSEARSSLRVDLSGLAGDLDSPRPTPAAADDATTETTLTAVAAGTETTLTSDGAGAVWSTHAEQARLLAGRYSADPDPATLAEALAEARRALDLAPDQPPVRSRLLAQLRMLLALDFRASRRLGVLDESLSTAQAALDLLSTGHRDRPERLHDLALALLEHHAAVPAEDTVRRAVTAARAAVDGLAEPAPNRADYHNTLANALSRHHSAAGDDELLNQAVQAARAAVETTGDTSPALAGRLSRLAARLTDLHRVSGDRQHLDEAVEVSRQAVLSTVESGPALLRRLGNLANRLTEISALDPDPGLREESVAVTRRLLELTPAGGPDHTTGEDGRVPKNREQAHHRASLGAGLAELYTARGETASLVEAVDSVRAAVELTGLEQPELPGHLSTLAAYLADLGTVAADAGIWEQATEAARRAVQLTPAGAEPLAGRLYQLSACLAEVYRLTGTPGALEDSVVTGRRAVAAGRQGPVDEHGAHLHDLSSHLVMLFEATGDRAALEEAVAVGRQAVARTPAASAQLARYQNNLANRLVKLHAVSGQVEALTEAAAMARAAAANTPQDSPELPTRLNNLANHLARGYAAGGDAQLLDEAIVTARRAVEASREDSAELVNRLANLANHLTRASLDRRQPDLLNEARAMVARALDRAGGEGQAPARLATLARRLEGLAAPAAPPAPPVRPDNTGP